MSFADKLAGKEADDYHLIVTTHPYLIQLGLGTMTTGTLYKWWNQSTADGVYLNRMAVNSREFLGIGATEALNGVETLLGMSSDTEFFWQGWKPHAELQNTGRYEKQDLSNYGSKFGGENAWTFKSDAGTVDVSNLSGTGIIGDHNKCWDGGTLDEDLNFKPEQSPASPLGTLKNMSPIFDLINLNRYMASFKDYYPRAFWDKKDSTIGGLDKKTLYANHELLTEIKSSKIGPYVEWSGEITFNINENNGTIDCPITEWASFKLYLFDKPRSKGGNKTLTVKNLTYVAPKRDVTGKTFSSAEDGGHRESQVGDSSSHGAAEIDLSYNSVTQKWESGTPQLFAKLVTDIGKPESSPTIAYLETSNIQEDLTSNDYKGVKFIPATGTAMPIRPQNGNPHQWQPNYLDSDDVRCSKTDADKNNKETLTVYNYNTRRSYKRDEEVLLSKIEGQWHVFPLWAGDDASSVKTSVDKWGEFSYLFTNSDFFFRDAAGGTFSPREAEQSFHADYYAGDSLNGEAEYGVDGGYDYIQPFTNENIRSITFENGFAQQTSFDYLDSTLFGIRGKWGEITRQSSEDMCSISTTSAVVNAAGHNIPAPLPEYASRNAAHAGLFFGCIFPAGYIGVNDYLQPNRDWDVSAKTSNATDNTSNYFNTSAGNRSFLVFDAEDASGSRNNCRQPASVHPTGALDGNTSWSRRDSRPSANLFAEYKINQVRTFNQIPADVMTNASPTGKNGSPIQPVSRFIKFHSVGFNGQRPSTAETKSAVKGAFLQGLWLGKDGYTGSIGVYTEEDSAFDFTPINNKRLTFRPCKMENYIQFGSLHATNWSIQRVGNLSQAFVQEHREGFHLEANRTQLDNKRPCSYFFEDRESVNAPDLWNTDLTGLLWGGNVRHKPRYNNLHEFSYWDSSNGATRWTTDYPGVGNWRGAGAFGVIATFNTVTANSQIDFSTDNIYGMGAAGHGRFNIQDGYDNQDHTWGVSQLSESYKQENILDLSVRIYQQHPRDQFLFDPRTYAVHHFNPDVSLEGDDSRHTMVETGDDYDYNYPLPISKADFQEVCRYEYHVSADYANQEYGLHPDRDPDTGPYSAQPLTVEDSYILSDITYEDGIVKPPIISSKFWLINTDRVGKLLPFKYNRKEVGIPTPTGRQFILGGGTYSRLATTLSNAGTPVTDIVNLMIVKNVGTGYVAGDTVGNGTKSISFTVKTVNAIGEIETLECTDRGTGLTVSDSASGGDAFNPDSDGRLKISTLQSESGTGFDAYFVASVPYNKLNTDPKPFLMKRDGEEIIRIASEKGQGTHLREGKTQSAENGAFINETHGVSYVLDPALKSANSQYDVFFHFHNDITMTWLASKENFHGNRDNPTECAEQHITVTINPQ